jgi:small GTP-binding protein
MAKNIQINDRNVRIQIWDTAGQEAFRSITRAYYKNSTCAFIVYDISERKTFDNVKSWLNECKDICYKDILICLIGNKCDLDTKRVVSSEEGQKFAEENNLLFFETSAKDGTNIQEVFVETVTIIVEKIERGQINLDMANNGIKIGKYPKTKNQDNQVNKAKDKNNCC